MDDFWNSLTSRISEWFSGMSDAFFLAEWWIIGFLILAGAFALSWFFGALPTIGNWIRSLSGVVVLLYAAFLVGITVAARHYREQKGKK